MTNTNALGRDETAPKEPIRCWYVVEQIPTDGPPWIIRQAWLGVSLPVRYDLVPEAAESITGRSHRDPYRTAVIVKDAVAVDIVDAIQALQLNGEFLAAEYWIEYAGRYAVSQLLFEATEGSFRPADYQPDFDPESDS
ncbi:hypothetical protein HY346_02230 [Candidatus Microgenomates bacterium]|nr:hypothetical protein [Candidatus Microgenomates bacterium]